MRTFLLFLLLLATYVAGRLPAHMRRGGGLPPPVLGADTPLPEPQWMDQKLDHFSANEATWKQRYFVNSTWWNNKMNNGPVFVLLGGEGPCNPAWIVADTSIMLIAQKYGALVFTVEHRFYGASHPTKNVSVENLQYLSSKQALADFAYFHAIMKVQYNLTDENKWISFGGSYSGALSAWLRQEYPMVVVGAVASSAPILAELNFVEYVEVVEASLGGAGVSCPINVAIAATFVSDMLKDKGKWTGLEKLFNVAPPLSSEMDAIQLMTNLAGNFEEVVQYNRDNTLFEGRPNNVTINDLCTIMNDGKSGVPLVRYAAVNKLMLGKDEFLDCNYNHMMEGLLQTSWNSSDVVNGARQWSYQTCTEFGYFQTTDSNKSHLFSDGVSLKYFTDMCNNIFGISPLAVSRAVVATNSYYGGRNVTGTNIVFPNGSIDPWHALSIIEDTGSSLKALFIDGTAHCANMYPPKSTDPEELTLARDEIAALVGSYLETT